MSTRVVHVRRDAFDVYVGRPMPRFPELRACGWGNPFRGENAIAKYRQWIEHQPKLLARLPELKDQALGCWCAPKGGLPGNINGRICHGEVLAALADGVSQGTIPNSQTEPPRLPSIKASIKASMKASMKAISLTQPWASLVMIGAKHIETRSWQPRGLKVGERLAIHASKGFPADARALCDEEPFVSALWQAGIVDWRELPLGCVIATVRFDGALRTEALPNLPDEEEAFGNFGPGRYAWLVSDPQPINPPIPAIGRLGLWEWGMPAGWLEAAS